jgi:predicted ATPase
MIREVEIRNFKSIRRLRLACRRINLFVGPPDAGKSNLLESLGMFGLADDPAALPAIARCRKMAELFHDQDAKSPVRVRADGCAWTLEYEPSADPPFRLQFSSHSLPIRFYRFVPLDCFPAKEPDFLRPPHGENMLHLLLRHGMLRKGIAGIFAEHGLRLVLRPREDRIELRKEAGGRIIAYPYAMASEALRRLAFHLLAIETNEGALLIFEEPEAHLHPHHVRFLGKRIALDARNQYWISTHSPHFLLAVLEKAPLEDVAVFLTARRDGETWARPLGEEEIQGIVDDGCGFFFDLERLMSMFERS